MKVKMYHGTVDTYLASILKEGLRPAEENAWQVSMHSRDEDVDDTDNIRLYETVDSVYLTEIKRHAVEFALTKTKYLAAKPGTDTAMFDVPHLLLRKSHGAPVIQGKPIVLEVMVEHDSPFCQTDPRDDYASRLTGSIPPEDIIGYTHVSSRIKEDENRYPHRSLSDMLKGTDPDAALLRMMIGR